MIRNRPESRVKAVLISLILCVTLLVMVVQVMGAGVQMKKIFAAEVREELEKTRIISGFFTEEDFAVLPGPMQRYYRHLTLVNQPKMSNARIIFNEVTFKNGNMDLQLYCEQFNFVEEPTRIAYMVAKIAGLIPFEGRDKYQNGQGQMTGKLAKLIKIFDATGPEMDQSALVTILTECLIVPTYALQDYITWEELNDQQARATIRYNGAEASGVFTIDDSCETVTFHTYDRYMDRGGGVFELVPWRTEIVGYTQHKQRRVPRGLKAIWELPEGDLVYFDGVVSSVEYDVEDF
ncbi:MAG: hypothetical protein GX971_02500 [Firmicutes bacterium]|nr:hypothetical protein [Bacillota bacterium]